MYTRIYSSNDVRFAIEVTHGDGVRANLTPAFSSTKAIALCVGREHCYSYAGLSPTSLYEKNKTVARKGIRARGILTSLMNQLKINQSSSESAVESNIGQATQQVSFFAKVFRLAIPFGKRRLTVVFLLVVLQGLFQVIGVTSIFPFLALAANPRRIYDSQFGRWFLSFLPEMDSQQLLTVAGMFAVAMMFAANFVNIASEYVRNRYAQDFGHWLRLRLLNRMLSQPYGYFRVSNSAVLFKKVYTDVMGYVNGVLLPLLESSARLLTSLLLIGTLLFIHLKIALTAAAVICGFYLAMYFVLRPKRQTMSDELKFSWKQCAVELQQLFGGIKPIKVQEVEHNFVDRFETPSRQIANHSAWLPVYTHVPRYVIEPIAFAGMIAVIVFLNVRGRDMAAILPNMGVMALAGYRLLPSLQLLYGQLTQVSASRFTIEEVYEEFERSETACPLPSRNRVAPWEWNDAIEMEDVSFKYDDGHIPVLESVTLQIRKNTSVAFVGQTGSGKSTIVDLLTGLHQPTSGRILVDGKPIEANMSAWRATIGYVPQEVFLTDDTITGNIAIGIPETKIDMARLRGAAQTAQILNFIESQLPDGFDTMVGERGVRLSGGQKQRLGLARALYRNPSILILDEATSALDHQTEAELMSAIYSISHKITIVMITHRLTTVQSCDQVFMIESTQFNSPEFPQFPTSNSAKAG